MRWLLFLLLWMPGLSNAQVNVEKLRSGDTEEGFSGSIGLNATFTSGNILFADFGTASHIEWRKNKDTLFWILNSRFAAKRTQSDLLAEPSVDLWDEEAHFANLMLQHIRYNRSLSDAWWWEFYVQYEFNEFLLLDRRLLSGTGPRLQLINGEHGGSWIGTSAMIEEERLNSENIDPAETVQTIALRSSSYLSTTLKWDDWTQITTVYFQPRFDDFDDFRMVGEASFVYKFNKTFALTIDGRIRHDSRPPQTPEGAAEVLTTDMSIKNGLKLSW